MRKAMFGLAAAATAVVVSLWSAAAFHDAGAAPAGASPPSALQMADHALNTVVGPDDEGSYALIDPIGPGGVKSVEAADEVFASTLQGGKYHPWQAYRDPFAPAPSGPPGTANPYKPPGGGSHGGNGR